MNADDPHVPQVVFACVRNGGRSVIARVLTQHYAQGRVRAVSAGTQPGEHIHPEAARALKQRRRQRSTGLAAGRPTGRNL